MQTTLIIVISLHVLAGVFWAGTSFTLARTGGAAAERLFRPQMGAAVIAVLTGGYLWHLLHEGGFGKTELVLALGALCAVAAAGVQGAMGAAATRKLARAPGDPAARSRVVLAQRIAAGLLAVTVVSMVAARYV